MLHLPDTLLSRFLHPQVKMVTGDQLLIGKETAKQLGMGTNMYTTEELLLVVPTYRKLLTSPQTHDTCSCGTAFF